MNEGTERMLADARTRNLDIDLVERPAARSLAKAAALLGMSPASVVKTLVVRRHDGHYLFALIPGDRQISWAKLRRLVGVNRLRLPEPELARQATGYERGTITPLGSSTAWPVFADSAVTGRIALGAGAHGYSALVDSGPLLDSLDAVVADISEVIEVG